MRSEAPLRNCYTCAFWKADAQTEAQREMEFAEGKVASPPTPEGFCMAAKKIDALVLHNGDLNRFPPHHTKPQSACNVIRFWGMGQLAHTPHKALVEYFANNSEVK